MSVGQERDEVNPNLQDQPSETDAVSNSRVSMSEEVQH